MSSDSWLESAYDDRNGALVDSDDPPDGWGWLPCDGTADCEADLHETGCLIVAPRTAPDPERIACPACTAEADEPCRQSCTGLAVYLFGQMHD